MTKISHEHIILTAKTCVERLRNGLKEPLKILSLVHRWFGESRRAISITVTFFNLILVTAVVVRLEPEICFLPGQLG